MTLRVIFMGTPEFSIPTLSEIMNKGHEVVGVYSQPPRKAGRGGKVRKTPVHDYADKAGLPVFTPTSLKKQEQIEEFKALDADIAIVVAYGLLLPKSILEACEYGCLNVHGSLLPRWRGAAPIQRAIMAGDTETGVMIMQMDEGLDTGDILLSEHIPISENMTAGDLHDEMMRRGADLLGRSLDALERGSLVPTPQPAECVTYASKISKSETKIDWAQPAENIHNHVRGLSPFPGAWFEIVNNKGKTERVKLLRTAIVDNINGTTDSRAKQTEENLYIDCGQRTIQLIELQREGKKSVESMDFINGLKCNFNIVGVEEDVTQDQGNTE